MSVKNFSPDFRQLFENFPGLAIVVMSDMTVAAVTDGYLKTTMVKREELIGRNLFEVFPENPDDAETHGTANVRGSIEKVLQTGEAHVLPIQKYDIQRPAEEGGGYEERYWKLMTFPPPKQEIAAAGGKIPYVLHRIEDITERLRLEQRKSEQENINAELQLQTSQIESARQIAADALIDAQSRLESALNAGEIGTWTWDIVNNRVVADANLAAFFSVSKEDADGGDIEKYLAVVHPDDVKTISELIGDALNNKDSYEAEYRLINANQSVRWVVARGKVVRDEAGAPTHLPGVIIDITSRKQAQEELLERAKLASLSADIGTALNKRKDLPTLLKCCADALVKHLNVAFAGIWTLDEKNQILEPQAISGSNTPPNDEYSSIPIGKFTIGRIAEQRVPYLTNDASKHAEIGEQDWAKSEKYVAFAGYPLIVADKLVGVMSVFSKTALSETVLEAMASFSNTIANAIERKQFEERLRRSNERFELVTRATNDAVWDWNLQTNEVWWNDSVQTTFGYTAEQVEPTSAWWYEHIHPDDRERVVSGIHAVIDHGGEKWSDEYRYLCADGSFKYVFDRGFAIHRDGQPIRMLGAMQDITGRREAEENLRKSQERLQLVLDTSALGLWYCDLPFDVLNWSNLTKEHFWLSPESVVTIDDFYRIIHPDDRERTNQAIDKSIEERGQYDIEYRTVSPQGDRVKWIRAIGRGFYDSNNDPYRFDGITIDISEDKMIASEREQLLASEKNARAESEQANRMKDEFLATLSHELRTPLSSILGWSRMLKEEQITGEQATRAIEIIERNAKSQAQLIEDVLDVSRIISGKMRLEVRPIDLTSVIETALDAVRPAAEAKNIRLQRVTDSNVMIAGDADRVQQIIWNLLSNAIKFTPKDGRVQIKMERVNSHVEITVADNGLGIEPETLPFIFERFRQSDSTTTRKYGGLGLGLAIVRHLVELHGGTVHAASEGLNHGTVFTVAFPLIAVRSKEISFSTEDETTEDTHPTVSGNVPFICPKELKNLRVLIVDDEPDTREMLLFIMETCQAQATGVASVEAALKAIETQTFDVMVSDIGMPERDGYDLIKTVRLLAPDKGGRLPAVALTAYARVEDRLKALNAGFQMHVPKPVDPAELLAVVASLANWNNNQ